MAQGLLDLQNMPVKLVAEQEIKVGKPIVVEGPSPSTEFAAVFEDDGETGYFYALDTTRDKNPIVDAVHIYDVNGVRDRHRPSQVQIVWSLDDRKAALLINDYPHAVFDFTAKRAYSRNGFLTSASDDEWSVKGHDWDDSALQLFA